MKTSDFHYDLPPELIAQTPPERRDASRMLLLDRDSGATAHRRFADLPGLLRPGDCLVLNDSRVIPARLLGVTVPGGAAVEVLLLREEGEGRWECITRPGRRCRPGARLSFGDGALTALVESADAEGNRHIRFAWEGIFMEVLERLGRTPLPPYITQELNEPERYQTVYAAHPGSAAAPTAGLHFTPELLQALEARGVGIARLTLHVGLGTYRPVKTDDIAAHHMHAEDYRIPQAAAERINAARRAGGRVVCVGTTSCRTLESAALPDGTVPPGSGRTDIFIYPGYRFRVMDALLTNFHLPESTLIMLVAAFAGYEHTMAAYREAVREKYRFFSFGDCMFIAGGLP